MSKLIDITGQTFGEWKVISKHGKNCKGLITWKCRCSCSREKIMVAHHLRHGRSTKCAMCSRGERRQKWTRHGLSADKKNMTPERLRDYARYKFYGLMPEDFQRKMHEQNNKCAICGVDISEVKAALIDHCHKTNQVRGLLCLRCNSLLGYAKDNIGTLESAIIYLQKYSTQFKPKERGTSCHDH